MNDLRELAAAIATFTMALALNKEVLEVRSERAGRLIDGQII